MKTHRCNLPKAKVLCLVSTIFVAAVTRAEVEDEVVKSFIVQPGGRLVVALDRGSIEVKGTEADSAHVRLIRRVRTGDGKANKILTNHIATITQEGKTVSVHAQYKDQSRTGWTKLSGNGPGLQVKCLISVPRRFDVDIKTAGGSICVADLTGKVNAQTCGGSLRFEKIRGTLSGQTSGGGVTVADCKGPVTVRTSGGSISLSDIDGNVDARTSGGSVRAERLAGKSMVKTSGGSIRVAAVTGQIEAQTSGGGITTDLPEQPTGNCSFRTTGGTIILAFGVDVAVDIDARTSGGRVWTDLAVNTAGKMTQKENGLRGKLNGGGPLIMAQTSGGSIRLRKM